MTPHGIVTPSTLADARELEPLLRPEDRREVEDMSGKPAIRNLLVGVMAGSPSFTLRTHEGAMVGIVSAIPVGTGGAVIGMVGTPEIEKVSTAFLRGSRDVLAMIDQYHGTLFNVCDARNEVHVRWLRWLGFHFIRKIDRHGAKGIPVYEFARIAPHV